MTGVCKKDAADVLLPWSAGENLEWVIGNQVGMTEPLQIVRDITWTKENNVVENRDNDSQIGKSGIICLRWHATNLNPQDRW